MDRKSVESSNISSIGYDTNNNILEVEFKNGDVYQYFNVPESEYKGIMEADSHGKYLNSNIKKNNYSYQKI